MKLSIIRRAGCACALALSLAGCDGSGPLLGVTRADAPNAAAYGQGFRILYNFDYAEGAYPTGLAVFDKHLYGTTLKGGLYGSGTLYETSASKRMKIVHDFQSLDGSEPTAPTAFRGALYGTTMLGGASGLGTAYKITNGTFTKIADFLNTSSSGAYPNGLTALNGSLFGTTLGGGADEIGTVFVLTSSGARTIYSFVNDGRGPVEPSYPLTACDGVLYGVTNPGGAYGDGTVFKVTVTGQETLIHSFGGSSTSDGLSPVGALVRVGHSLYGVTQYGGITGRSGSGYDGYGTIFEITPAAMERVVYRFTYEGRSGYAPRPGLLYLDGRLYGTTSAGSAHANGAIFSLKTSGTDVQVIGAFPSRLTSANTISTLVHFNNALFGTTFNSGAHEYGTLFRQFL